MTATALPAENGLSILARYSPLPHALFLPIGAQLAAELKEFLRTKRRHELVVDYVFEDPTGRHRGRRPKPEPPNGALLDAEGNPQPPEYEEVRLRWLQVRLGS